MPWLLISSFFLWCAFREIRASIVAPPGYEVPRPVDEPYLALLLVLAALFAWPPLHRWHFEHFLSARATELADEHRAHVHCNTLLDTMFDSEMLAGGHTSPATGNIAIQPPGCEVLSAYLRHPSRATSQELWSLGLFTHESMHVRGELDEAKTECEAVQRNYRSAKLLGVPDRVARQNALDYYNIVYKERQGRGPLAAMYYSSECASGKALDEHLSDSIWTDFNSD